MLFDDELDNKVKCFVFLIRKFGSVFNIVIVNINEGVFFVGCFFLGEKEGYCYICILVFFFWVVWDVKCRGIVLKSY